MYVYIYTYIYVCIHICIYIYILTYIETLPKSCSCPLTSKFSPESYLVLSHGDSRSSKSRLVSPVYLVNLVNLVNLNNLEI